ncbi:hypothetical protein BY996DRAFT_565349 [Phakopsora pachyrhizi]|nr:hypothetical protein BY996DRAFT_565349 [Phakopsora pachyrhizi]
MNLFRPATPPRPRTWDDENGFETFEVEDLNLDLEVTITCDNQPTGSSSSSENEINYQNPGVRRAARDSVHSSRAHQLRSNQSSHLHRSHQTISLGHVQQVMNDLEASELLYNSNRNRKRLRYSIDGEGNPSFAESVTSQEDFSDDDRVLDPGISHPNQKQLRSSSSRLVYDGTNQLYQIKTPSDQSLTRQSPLSRMSPSDTLTGPRIRFNRQTTRIVHQSDKDPSSSDSYCHPPVIGPDDSEDQGQDVLVEKIRPTDQNSTSPNVNDENDPNCHSTMITSEAGPSNPRAARSIVKDLKSITHQENCETRSRDDLESENDDDDDDDDDDAKLNRESDSEDERENKRSGDNDFDKGAVVDGSDDEEERTSLTSSKELRSVAGWKERMNEELSNCHSEDDEDSEEAEEQQTTDTHVEKPKAGHEEDEDLEGAESVEEEQTADHHANGLGGGHEEEEEEEEEVEGHTTHEKNRGENVHETTELQTEEEEEGTNVIGHERYNEESDLYEKDQDQANELGSSSLDQFERIDDDVGGGHEIGQTDEEDEGGREGLRAEEMEREEEGDEQEQKEEGRREDLIDKDRVMEDDIEQEQKHQAEEADLRKS